MVGSGIISRWLEKNEIKFVFGMVIVIVIIMSSMFIHISYKANENRQALYDERIYFEGEVTSVQFEEEYIIVQLDNASYVRMDIGRFYYETIYIELWQEYQFALNGFNTLVDFQIIQGDE